MRVLALVLSLLAMPAQSAGIVAYLSSHIESWTGCDITAHTYYAPTSTGVFQAECTADPTPLPYGYQPPRVLGNVVLQVRREGVQIGGRDGCGLLMHDHFPDDEPFLALDCRGPRLTTAWGVAP